jgi:nucleoside 2-deoxyribosyltransferase
VIVVGGTYRERCTDPPFESLRGSGFRAAASVRASTDVKLISTIDDRQREEADLVAAGLGLEVDWVGRSEPVRFTYFTPVSPPEIDGRMATASDSITATAGVVLVFGMIEIPFKEITISADRVVIDPQQPRDLVDLDLATIHAKERAIVANSSETKALGGSQDVLTAAKSLRERYGAAVVVTKLAARGALVTTRARQEKIGPFPTKTVWPVGSGDVFAAAFTYAWGEQSLDAVEATRVASRAAAGWCSSRRDDYEIGLARELDLEELDPSKEARVYLASPFVTLSQRWLVHLARDVLRGLGAKVFSPFHDVGAGGIEVAEQDLVGLRECSSILAAIDGSDPGTVFEAGYATALGIPVVCYAEQRETDVWKMLAGTGAEFHADFSSALYRATWTGMTSGS